MKNRTLKHFELSSALSSLDNNEIKALLSGNEIKSGWGANFELKLLGHKVFVKSIPLTSLENKNHFNTKNMFNLPLYYNYGVGSAGMGAFRELNTHIKTTNWVLSGETEGFPLMHHFRIIKKDGKPKTLNKIQQKKHDDYIKYWNSSKRIEKYILERKSAEYEIILFLEFIPHVLMKWIKPNVSRINEMKNKAFRIFDFLNSKGIIHFDAHFGNILTDGKEVFLTDFGLALDKNYQLSENESNFYKEHQYYDQMEFLGCSSLVLESCWQDLNKKRKKELEDKFRVCTDTPYYEKLNIMLDNLDGVQKIMKLNEIYIKYLKRNLPVIKLSNKFFYDLRMDNKKGTKYPFKLVKKEFK